MFWGFFKHSFHFFIYLAETHSASPPRPQAHHERQERAQCDEGVEEEEGGQPEDAQQARNCSSHLRERRSHCQRSRMRLIKVFNLKLILVLLLSGVIL